MDSGNLVTEFYIKKYEKRTTYSAGYDIFFARPCVAYVKKGYAKFFYKGKTIYAHEGDLVYIAPETQYQSIWYGEPDVEWYSVSFDFNSPYAFRDFRFQVLKNYSGELFEKMYEHYENSPFLSVSYFYCILDDIYKKLTRSTTHTFHPGVLEAMEYIENNYNKSVSIKELAQICHMSESGFFKVFKKATGTTPVGYKHNIMIQHAVEMITKTSMSIEEISSEAGFPSSNYFRKVFFNITGKKPKELRKTKK